MYRITYTANEACFEPLYEHVHMDRTSVELAGLQLGVSYKIWIAGKLGEKTGPLSQSLSIGPDEHGDLIVLFCWVFFHVFFSSFFILDKCYVATIIDAQHICIANYSSQIYVGNKTIKQTY